MPSLLERRRRRNVRSIRNTPPRRSLVVIEDFLIQLKAFILSTMFRLIYFFIAF